MNPNEISKTITTEFLSEISNDGFQLKDIPNSIALIMSKVGKISKLNGQQKKQIVINTLLEIIKQTDIAGKYDNITDTMLNIIVPPLIDTFVSVDKQKIVINPKIKKCCFPF